MSQIEVVLSLNLVGSREGLMERERWPFCLRLSAAYDAEPGEPERDQWARALLPWSLFPTADPGTPQLRAFLFGGDGDLELTQDILVEPHVVWPEFTGRLRTELEAGLVDASNLARYAFASVPSPDVMEVIDDAEQELLLPIGGVLQGVADLPASLSHALHAAWYFSLPREWLDQASGPLASLGVVPVALFDQRNNVRLVLNGREAIAPLHRFRFFRENKETIEAHATGPGVLLKDLRESPSTSLDTYWLKVADSRLDTIEGLDERIGRGLDPRSLVTVLPIASLAEALSVESTASVAEDRHAIAKAFLQRAREYWATVDASLDEAERARRERERTSEILEVLRDVPREADPLVALRGAVAQFVGRWWIFTWPMAGEDKPWQAAMLDKARLEGFPGLTGLRVADASAIVAACLEAIWPSTTDRPHPCLPNEAIHLRIGDPAEVLLHEHHAAAANVGSAANVAAIGLLVRRAPTVAQLPARPWRMVTASVAALDTPEAPDEGLGERPFGLPVVGGQPEPLPHTAPIIRGLPTTFINRVLRSEVAYRGEHPGAQSPLRFGHRYDGENVDAVEPLLRLAPLSWETPGALGNEFAEISHTRAPALRYGDAYEFAAFAVDRVGGTPKALTEERFGQHGADSYDIAPAWNTAGPPPDAGRSCTITFGRRVPVGEPNIVGDGDWPAMPEGVALRSREWHDAQLKGPDNVSVILLGDPARFERVNASCTFRVEPPRIDEFTLSRWSMPAIWSDAGSERPLAEELERILRARDALNERDLTTEEARAIAASLLPHDPSVTAIGVRLHVVDRNGAYSIGERTIVLTKIDPFHAEPIIFEATMVPGPGDPRIVRVPEASFCRIDLHPLVLAADYDRFDDEAFGGTEAGRAPLVERDPWVDGSVTYRAFEATRVLVEAASEVLPESAPMYDALVLEPDERGRVRVEIDAARVPAAVALQLQRDLAFVDSFSLVRQRWTWRNRPLVDPGATPPVRQGADWPDWRRRMSGGAPRELWDPAQRDDAAAVLTFDELASIDRGFVDRGGFVSRWPRGETTLPPARAVLLYDDRDAVAASDYLRYGLRVRSRYASIARNHAHREREARRPGIARERDRRWRRVVAPFRGDVGELKPLRILSVLPLTKPPRARPFGDAVSSTANPFLVVLDEVWHRENGHEEGVEAWLDLEPIEAGQTTAPYRVAPLPDHHVMPAGREAEPYYRGMVDTLATGEPRLPLDVFGPFGYTLDRADSESLANATAFVVYPPDDVGPHWWMGVRLRRVLRSCTADGTVSTRRAPRASDIHHFYTLPGRLVENEQRRGVLTLRGDQGVATASLTLHLTSVPDPDPLVRGQYRYALLLGPSVFDASRGSDLFMPRHAVWLAPGLERTTWSTMGARPGAGEYVGRVVELLLNGRYESVAPEIDGAEGLRDLLMKMLPASSAVPQDAPAAMRRVSDEFLVKLE